MYGRGYGTGERRQRRKQTSRRQLLKDIAYSISQKEQAGIEWSFEQYGITDESEKLVILSMVE